MPTASQSCWHGCRYFSQLRGLMISLHCYLSLTSASYSRTQSRARRKSERAKWFSLKKSVPDLVPAGFNEGMKTICRLQNLLYPAAPLAVPLPSSQTIHQRREGNIRVGAPTQSVLWDDRINSQTEKFRGGHESKQLVTAWSNWFQQESAGLLVSLWGSGADSVGWCIALFTICMLWLGTYTQFCLIALGPLAFLPHSCNWYLVCIVSCNDIM